MSFKTCSRCSKKFTRAQWDALKSIGHQVVPPYEGDVGEVLNLKNCPCGSTLAVQELFTGADVERGVAEEMKRGHNRSAAQILAIDWLTRDPRHYGG